MAQWHVVEDPFENLFAVLQKEEHGVNHDKEIEKKAGRSGRHARRESDQESTHRLRGCGKVFEKLLLTRDVLGERGKARDQPIVRVEGAGGAEMLSDPWDRVIAHVDCLLPYNSAEDAE